MFTSNKFKRLLPNYKESYSADMNKGMMKPEYRNQELMQRRDPFKKTRELFQRRSRKKDQEHY